MQVIYRYGIAIIVACSFLLYTPGICQEGQEEEITWDDIEETSSNSGNATQKSALPYSSVTQVQVNKDETQEVKALPEADKEATPPAAEEVAKTQPKQGKVVVKPKIKTGTSGKKIPAAKKRRSEEESTWKRATTITSEDPATNRDIFITNPNRE